MTCPIVVFFHCRRCIEEGQRPNIAAGLTEHMELMVWCENHDIAVSPTFAIDPGDLEELQKASSCGHQE